MAENLNFTLKTVKTEEIVNNGEIKKRKSLEDLIAEDLRSPLIRPKPLLELEVSNLPAGLPNVPVVPTVSHNSPTPVPPPETPISTKSETQNP